jgi:hypothetical protein
MYEAIVTVNGQVLRSGQFPNEQTARKFLEGLQAIGVTPQDQRIVEVAEEWEKVQEAPPQQRPTAGTGG